MENQVIGALVQQGGVAHVHQAEEFSSLLGEERFFALSGLRMSWPARVGVLQLLKEDILLQDIRDLIHAGEMQFEGDAFALAAESKIFADYKLQRIADAVVRVNEQLPAVLESVKAL